eukprot:2418759-Prymnesium_polylepis.1
MSRVMISRGRLRHHSGSDQGLSTSARTARSSGACELVYVLREATMGASLCEAGGRVAADVFACAQLQSPD